MKIVKCSAEDICRVSEFYDKVTNYLVRHINYPKWVPGEYPGRPSVEPAVFAGAQYACIDGGRIIGAFVLDDDPNGDYDAGDWSVKLNRGDYLIIHALAVDSEVYQRGTGRKMVEFCIDKAKCEGYRALRLDVVPDNVPAKKLYESMGFLYSGDTDLHRFAQIPLFSLYEMNF